MSNEFVIVYRSTNPIEAEIVEDVLREEGMTPHLIGTRSAALIGVTDYVLGLRIEVPQHQSEEAVALVEALLNSEEFKAGAIDEPMPQDKLLLGGNDDDDDNDDDLHQAEEENQTTKKRKIALALPWFIPAGAHFYLGRTVTGVLLCVYMLYGFALLIGAHPQVGAIFWLGGFFADLLISQATFPRNRDEDIQPKSKQLLTGVIIGASMIGIAYLFETSIMVPH